MPDFLHPVSRRTVLATVGAACAPAWASSSPWPSQPIKILVGFPGGSSPDLVARTLAEPLSRALGQPVIVENRAGAAGNIAAQQVAQATDQHTLGLMINGNLTIAKLLNPRLGYNPATDLQPISLIATAPLVLVAPIQQKGSAKEVLQAARQAGDRWSYGSPGVGTVAHIGMELLKARAGWSAVHVPYPGNPQVITALISGDLQLALLPPGLALPQVKAGKLRVVGVTSAGRSTLVPDVPSLAELGVAGFELDIWDALAAPASLPRPIASRLAQLVADITRSPDIRARLFQQGWQVAGTTAEGLALRIKTDTTILGDLIKTRGIKAE